MEVAVTVGCPAVGEVEVAVVAYMQDCAPVIDWVAEPWRAGEVAPTLAASNFWVIRSNLTTFVILC